MLKHLVILARPHQWIKNGIVMVSLVFAGEMTDVLKVEQAVFAALIFCLLSSSIYVLNDIFDQESDREHPRKKYRPIAAGLVSTGTASTMAVLLMVIGLGSAWFINIEFFLCAVVFVLFNLLYSKWLKHLVIFDVMSVAMSFVLRAFAGALAISVPASKWLIANTLLLALFLAFGKRRHELALLKDSAINHRKSLSRYSQYLLDQMMGVTTASVVVMYSLYTLSSEVSEKLGTNNLYMTIPLVLYGIFRYLYLIHREDKGGSPTRVLVSDRPILATVTLWFIASIIILYVK